MVDPNNFNVRLSSIVQVDLVTHFCRMQPGQLTRSRCIGSRPSIQQ
jgi:hypothetical protein